MQKYHTDDKAKHCKIFTGHNDDIEEFVNLNPTSIYEGANEEYAIRNKIDTKRILNGTHKNNTTSNKKMAN
jgi:hypothetical protein